jgi:hypothetical protein
MTGAEAFRHFGMSRNPFVGKRPELDFYTGPQHRDALAFLDHALHSNDLLLALTGDPGAGKRMTLQVALARGLPGAVEAHVSGGVNEPLEFLSAVLEGFGFGGITASRDEMRGLLQVFFNHERQKGITTVIVAEQLEAVPAGLMEELNWLSLLEPVRAGRLKLALLGDERLERQMFAPRMQALRQMVRWQPGITSSFTRRVRAAPTRAQSSHPAHWGISTVTRAACPCRSTAWRRMPWRWRRGPELTPC